jgi:beta-lactam-binding protein with PASTA domain
MKSLAICALAAAAIAGCGGSNADSSLPDQLANLGPPRETVPNVVHRRWSVARRALFDRGLQIRAAGLSNLCAGVAGGGRILLQDPAAGKEVDRGSTVRVQTSCHG